MIPRDQPIAVRIDVREMIHHGSSLCYAPACDGRRFVQRAFALWIAAGIVISALMTCIAGHRLRDWSAAARQRAEFADRGHGWCPLPAAPWTGRRIIESGNSDRAGAAGRETRRRTGATFL